MANAAISDPKQVKVRVQQAYSKAVADRFTFHSKSGSSIDCVLRDVRLYGRDAAVDFVDTHLDAFIQEAVAAAECKQPSTTIHLSHWGRSAVAGMASRLEELTALRIDTAGNALKVIWADTTPNLI